MASVILYEPGSSKRCVTFLDLYSTGSPTSLPFLCRTMVQMYPSSPMKPSLSYERSPIIMTSSPTEARIWQSMMARGLKLLNSGGVAMVGKCTPLRRRASRSVSAPLPAPRNGVAVRPSRTMPFSDISFLRLSQLKPISRSTAEYESAVTWWASSTTTHEVSAASLASCAFSPVYILYRDCMVATMTPFSSSSSSMSIWGSSPPGPQKRCRRSVVPLRPRDSKTVRNVLNACSHSSWDWATQSTNFESRCCGSSEGLPSLNQFTRASTVMRVLPEPVGTAISLRFTGLPSSAAVPSSMPRISRPVECW